MDNNKPIVDHMVVKGDKILETGTGFNKGMHTADKYVDLNGKTVFPGFCDTHMHMRRFSELMDWVDLGNSKTEEDIIRKLKSRLKEIKKNEWILAYNYDDSETRSKKVITRHVLNKVSKNIPIFVRRVCGHISIVNSAAINIEGLSKNTPDPAGGKIERDESGFPNGILKEKAKGLLRDILPHPGFNEYKEILVRGLDYALKHGLTSFHTQDSSSWSEAYGLYKILEKEKRLNIRSYVHITAKSPDNIKNIVNLGFKTGKGTKMVKHASAKVIMDGSMGGETAALLEPYANNNSNNGIMCYTKEQITEMICRAQENDIQAAVHAIGDKAALTTLNAIRTAKEKYPGKNLRHRLVHCQLVNDKILKLMKKLNVIAEIQPIFQTDDSKWTVQKLGFSRSNMAYAWKSILEKNIMASGGSDCPVSDLNPFKGIYAAVTRRDKRGLPKEGWQPWQKLTVYEALKLYTVNAAYVSFEEMTKGTLTQNKLADFIVVDNDPYLIVPEEIKNIKVLKTFVGGRLVFET